MSTEGAISPLALCLDLDGVLWDSSIAHADAYEEVCRAEGIRPIAYRLIAGRETEEAWTLILEASGETYDCARLRELVLAKQCLARKTLRSRPPLVSDVASLGALMGSGLTTALVTGSSLQTTEIFLKELLPIHSFDVIVTAESVKSGKPSPDPYLFAARELSVPPSSCWILEDSEAGLTSAVAAGAVTVHLASGEHCGGHEPVMACVRTLTEFIDLAVQARCGSRELQK